MSHTSSHQELAKKYMNEVMETRRKIFEVETAAANKDERISELERELAEVKVQVDGRGSDGHLICEARTRSNLREESDAGQQQIAELTAALEGRTAELRELQDAIEDGRSRFYEQDQKLEQSEHELAEAEVKLLASQAEIDEIRGQYETAQSRAVRLEQDAASLSDQNARLHEGKGALESKVPELEARLAKQEQIAYQCSAEARREGAHVLELQASYSTLEQDAANLRLEKTALEGKIKALENLPAEQNRLATEHCANAESKAATKLSELQALRAKLQQQTTTLDHQETTLRGTIHNLESQLAKHQDLAATYHVDAQRKGAQNVALQTSLSLERRGRRQPARRGEEADARIKRLQAQLKDQCQRNAEFRIVDAGWAARFAEVEREVGQRDARVAELEGWVEGLHSKVEEADRRAADREELVEALQGLVESKQARLEDLERLLREKDDGDEEQ